MHDSNHRRTMLKCVGCQHWTVSKNEVFKTHLRSWDTAPRENGVGRDFCLGIIAFVNCSLDVVSSNHARITMKTILVSKAQGNYSIKCTHIKEPNTSVSGFCYDPNHACYAVLNSVILWRDVFVHMKWSDISHLLYWRAEYSHWQKRIDLLAPCCLYYEEIRDYVVNVSIFGIHNAARLSSVNCQFARCRKSLCRLQYLYGQGMFIHNHQIHANIRPDRRRKFSR